jgi:hypothetical protein
MTWRRWVPPRSVRPEAALRSLTRRGGPQASNMDADTVAELGRAGFAELVPMVGPRRPQGRLTAVRRNRGWPPSSSPSSRTARCVRAGPPESCSRTIWWLTRAGRAAEGPRRAGARVAEAVERRARGLPAAALAVHPPHGRAQRHAVALAPFACLPEAGRDAVLEYLLRRFHVHEHNVEATLKAALPFHATPIFARLVSKHAPGSKKGA